MARKRSRRPRSAWSASQSEASSWVMSALSTAAAAAHFQLPGHQPVVGDHLVVYEDLGVAEARVEQEIAVAPRCPRRDRARLESEQDDVGQILVGPVDQQEPVVLTDEHRPPARPEHPTSLVQGGERILEQVKSRAAR